MNTETKYETQEETGGVFSVQADVLAYNRDVFLYGKDKAKTKTIERLAGNFKFQAWEISGLPVSDQFKYKKLGNNLIFEPDKEIGLDIEEVTDSSVRLDLDHPGGVEGLEIQAVREWKKAILEAEIGTTIIQFNPRATLEEIKMGSCNYKRSQLNFAYVNQNEEVEVYQIQSELDQLQGGMLINELTNKRLISSEFSLKEVMTTTGLVRGRVKPQDVLDQISTRFSLNFDSFSKIEVDKRFISEQSWQAAINYFQSLEVGLNEAQLKQLHGSLLTTIIPQETKAKLFVRSEDRASFESSCGEISFNIQIGVLNGLFINSESGIKCKNSLCGELNICTKERCWKCDSRLSNSK